MSALLVLWAATAGFLDATVVPVQSDRAACTFLPVNADARADLAILDAETLTILFSEPVRSLQTVPLPEGASAVDFADLNGDGARECIVVAGEQVYQSVITPSEAPPFQPLFRAPGPFASHRDAPFFHVLGVTWEGRTVLALPGAAQLELRSADGSVVAAFDLARERAGGAEPFTVWPSQPSQAAPAGALEWRVNHLVTFTPELPAPLAEQMLAPRTERRATLRQAREVASQPPSFWPWFPLRPGGEDEVRVLYAHDAGQQQTLVRLQDFTRPASAAVGQVGPVRRYPGLLLHPAEGMPDFDGDGHHDLLLVSSELPAPTVDRLSQALVEGVWATQLAVHRYDPVRGRFAPRAAGRLRIEVPLMWALRLTAGAPLRHLVAGDVDGDGFADLGLSTGNRRYTVWRWREDGFTGTPYVHTAGHALTELVFAERRGPGERIPAIVLRGGDNLYVLRAPD